MLLMIEKFIRGWVSFAICRYAKANNKYMKYCDENKESLHLNYWGLNDLYGWAMLEKFSVDSFNWLENKFQFNKDSTKATKKIFSWSSCLISWKITWPSQWFKHFYLRE